MLKKILILLLIMGVAGFVTLKIMDEPVPQGEQGQAAERLADKMLKAVNHEAWEKLPAVKWSFYRGHDFIWDKRRDLVEVKWDNMRVLLNTREVKGVAFREGQQLSGSEAEEAIQTAWEYFANDSFWLAAPFKIKDPGTERRLVDHDGKDALLVTYSSGGVTPGDSYLWILDEDGTPSAWKMWASILPIGGLSYTWDNWKTYNYNVKLSSSHEGIMDVNLSNIEVSDNVANLNKGIDPFKEM